MRLQALALAVALVGCSSGAVKGKVILGETPANLGIYAALWQVDAQLSDANDPHSTLVPKPNGAAPTFMGTVVVGTTSGKAGSYDYAFHTLDRGLYQVGAYLADPKDPQPDILSNIHNIDPSLQEVDPDSKTKTKQEVSHDVYLGISAPGTGTIRGTVHASTRAAASPISVFAGDGSLITSTALFFDQQKIPVGSTDAPYALFNVPLGKAYLFADADVGNDGSLGNDFFGFASPTPVEVTDGHLEFNDVDIWVDKQSPELGSISGTLQLNAPVSSALVQLVLEQGDYGSGDLVALTNVVVSGSSASFTIPSVPFGAVALSSAIAVNVNGTQLVGSSYYPGPPNLPGAITISTAAPNVTDVQLPVGVGQILGKVNLKNIPSTDGAVWVVVSADLPNPSPGQTGICDLRGGGSAPTAPQLLLDAQQLVVNGATSLTADYSLFGYVDGTFNVMLVPTATPASSLSGTLNAGGCALKGNPASVKIEGGNRVNSQFDYDFTVQ